MSEPARVALSEAEVRAVRAGRWVHVGLKGWFELGEALLPARSALVGVPLGGRTVAAWANVCLHQPTALDTLADREDLDGGARAAPMDDARVHLLCHSHGALFRARDGYCVSGPCEGQNLIPVDVEDDGSAITLVLPPP